MAVGDYCVLRANVDRILQFTSISASRLNFRDILLMHPSFREDNRRFGRAGTQQKHGWEEKGVVLSGESLEEI